MNKAELVEQMAADAGITKAQARTALDSLADAIKQALKKKEGKVSIAGLGTFSKRHRKARKGINPQTGEELKIKARNVLRFQPAKALKEAL